MGYRRKSRELAMQALFYMDEKRNNPKEMVELFLRNFKPPEKVRPFFLKLINGVLHQRNEIDTLIERFSSNWKIDRMACVDRNIIRIAVYELLCLNDIPSKVTINEAIDIGKKYGAEDSGAFINGVLDSIRILAEKGEIQMKSDFRMDTNLQSRSGE